MLLSSSKRALSSTIAVTCFPCSPARASALTIGESPPAAIERLLDCEDVRIFCRFGDELHDRVEGFVRVMKKDVSLANRGKQIVRVAKRRHVHRSKGLVPHVSAVVLGKELHQVRHVEHVRRAVDVAVRVELERVNELLERRWRRLPAHLQANRVSALAPAKLLLDRLQEIFGFFFVDLEVEVARHAERVNALQTRAREDAAYVPSDQIFEEDERMARRRPIREDDARHLQKARNHHRHLHDAKRGHATNAFTRKHHADVEALVANVRKRVTRVDRDGRENREELAMESLVQLRERCRRQALRLQDDEPSLPELWQKILRERGELALDELVHAERNRGELLGDREAVRGELVYLAGELLLQPGDAHHEKLVQVGRHDRVEFQPFHERNGFVLGFVQDA